MGNSFVYPAPRSSYKHCYDDPTLVYVPQKVESGLHGSLICSEPRKATTKIPCRYIQYQNSVSPYLIIFFHGNSEDIGESLSHFLCKFTDRFAMNILCPEYPSYGIYTKKDDSISMDEAMMKDARQVIKYCQTQLKYKLENIILIGRSLGTGIIARLASEYKVRGAIFISSFTSIRDIAKNLVGSILAKVVPDVFRTIDYADKIKSPTLFIHGEEDALIPPEMSCQLFEKVRTEKMITINEEMTHNHFRLEIDVLSPIHSFMIEKLDLKDHLSSRRVKLMDFYIPRSSMFNKAYGEGFDGDFDGGFYEERMTKSTITSKAI